MRLDDRSLPAKSSFSPPRCWRQIRLLFIILVVLIGLAGCGLLDGSRPIGQLFPNPTAEKASAEPTSTPNKPSGRRDDMLHSFLPYMSNREIVNKVELSPAAQEWVDQTLAAMTTEQKLGQLIITGVPGTELSEETCQNIQKMQPGGITFQWYNVVGSKQMQLFTESLRGCLSEAGGQRPFLTLAHEGEYVQRFDDSVTTFPAALAIGAAGDPENGYRIGQAAGQELAYSGINMVLAPVADVLLDYDNEVVHQRTFGDSPQLVSEYVSGFVRGYLENGVMPVLKHFPGHGGVSEDSHRELPVDPIDITGLEQSYLPPFQAGLDAGDLVVMLSHVAYPTISGDELPATFSPPVLNLLRAQMGFAGIIMSDHMDMKAATTFFPVDQASVKAVEAGVDLILLNEPDQAKDAYNRLLDAYQSGNLSPERIDQAVRRVLMVKAAMGFDHDPVPPPEPDWDAHRELARQVAYRSVTLYRDQDRLFPLPATLKKVLVVGAGDEDFTFYGDTLIPALEQAGFNGRSVTYDVEGKGQSGSETLLAKIDQQADWADVIVVFTYQAYLKDLTQGDNWQKQVVELLEETGKPMIVIAWRSPTDLLEFPEIHNYLATFGNILGQRQAVVDILIHGQLAQGISPLQRLK